MSYALSRCPADTVASRHPGQRLYFHLWAHDFGEAELIGSYGTHKEAKAVADRILSELRAWEYACPWFSYEHGPALEPSVIAPDYCNSSTPYSGPSTAGWGRQD